MKTLLLSSAAGLVFAASASAQSIDYATMQDMFGEPVTLGATGAYNTGRGPRRSTAGGVGPVTEFSPRAERGPSPRDTPLSGSKAGCGPVNFSVSRCIHRCRTAPFGDASAASRPKASTSHE